jgi:hypothetical protein
MSIWLQYDALAQYLTLKYQSELHIVLRSLELLAGEARRAKSLDSNEHLQQHYDTPQPVRKVSTAIRSAPAVSTYGRSARAKNITPKNIRHIPSPTKRARSIIYLVRGPPRTSLFAQKGVLLKRQKDRFLEDCGSPELIFFIFWEATHGRVDLQQCFRHVFHQQQQEDA